MTTIKDISGNWLESAPAKRQKLANDQHRPRFHFLPPNNWMNDPNGLIYWQGQYHMFYQHNPNNPFWGDIHWGHAVSDNLVHWKDLPLALLPDEAPVDDGGCWSGCAIDNNSVPTFFFTGVKNGIQGTCVATSDANLIYWQKDAANPIEVAPKLPGYNQKDYRDPYLWREGDMWYQVIGTQVHNRGEVLLYRSSNLRDWEYLHPLIPDKIRGTLEDGADICECPNFFPLGNKYLLIFSVWRNHALYYPVAFVGEFKDLHFYPEYMQRLDYGMHCFYAPLSFKANNRQLMFGWLQEQRPKEEQIAAGWSGVMSLPRVLNIENNRLKLDFAPELQILRQKGLELSDFSLDKTRVLESVKSDRLELQLSLERKSAISTGITLHHSEDERTTLSINWLAKELELKNSTNAYKATFEGFEDNIDFHLYVDHSVIEIIVNREVALSCRVYPKQLGGSVELFSEGESKIVALKAWNLDSIWA